MNQACTTYQSDFTPFDWLRNNVITDMNEFCCSENVDDCLKYVSQEFCALGFPSIYSNSSDRPLAVNCDIVKFLNVTYELLRNNSEYIQKNEDLESRNQRLCTDLTSLNKKNSVLKSSLEQNERKLSATLERERQLKERNEQLLQQLKAEKEEVKKLSGQLRQQKVSYQHEIKKYENNMNHIKAKINQLLSDKNPNKKIATMTSSHILPRNSGQRGKWKTDVAATNAVEEMYNSVISAYETRTKELCTELNLFHQCFNSVILEILETISVLQDETDNNSSSITIEGFCLNEIKKECWDINSLEAKFKYLLDILKKCVLKKIHEMEKISEKQKTDFKLELSKDEKSLEDCIDSQQVMNDCNINASLSKEQNVKLLTEESINQEKKKIEVEKLALSKALEDIEKEKAEIAVQKVALLRLAIQQKIPTSSWHESIKTFPSVSVITSQSGSRTIPNLNYLKSCLSTPEQIGQTDTSLSPQWISDEMVNNATFYRKSVGILPPKSFSASESSAGSPLPTEIKFSNSDLPSWAANKTVSQSSFTDDFQSTTLEISHNVTSNEELFNESSNEEISMLRLKAAVEDIEKKKTTP